MASVYIPDFSEMLAVAHSRGADSEAPGLWNGLVGAWPLAEGGGATVHDLSGFQNHGTLTNMDPATDHVVTEKGWALDFDQASSQDVSLSYGTDPPGALTVAAIVRLDSESGGSFPGIWWRGGSNDGALLHWRSASNTFGWAVYSGAWQIAESNALTLGEFYHVVGVYDGANVLVYVNGQLGPTVDTAASVTWTNTSHFIGRYVTDYFDGVINNVPYWHRALALDEIQQLYAEPYAMHTLRRRVYKAAAVGGNPYSAYAQQVA